MATPRAWPWIRDVTLFLAGLAGVLHETIAHSERPTLLLLFAAMMGMPVLTNDRRPRP